MVSIVPKVSVCIPVRNGGVFLQLAVESALNQTYTDFEIIIVDNASTDHTVTQVEKIAAENNKVRLFRNEINIGLVGNFNACLNYAQGDYVKFLCADDLLLPGCLGKMAAILDDDPSVSLVVGGRQIINEAGAGVTVQNYAPEKFNYTGFDVINRCLYGSNYIGEPSAVMFRRAMAVRGFSEAMPHLMDIEMWFHILEQGKMENLPEPLCAIRHHGGQMTVQSIRSSALVEDNVRLFEEYAHKPYLKNTFFNRLQRRVRMTYRVWLCREQLDRTRRTEILKQQSSRLVYYFVMAVVAPVLAGIRHTHLLQR